MSEPTIDVLGRGPRRSLSVDGHELIDGSGEPVLFDKAAIIAAGYGQRNEAWHAMRALARPEDLKCAM